WRSWALAAFNVLAAWSRAAGMSVPPAGVSPRRPDVTVSGEGSGCSGTTNFWLVLNAITPTWSLGPRAAMARAAADREMAVLSAPPESVLPAVGRPLGPADPGLQWQAAIDPLVSMASTSATDA